MVIERIEDLAHVAETGVAQRHVAEPRRAEAQLLGAACELLLASHRGLVALRIAELRGVDVQVIVPEQGDSRL